MFLLENIKPLSKCRYIQIQRNCIMNDNERLSVAQTVYLGHHSNNKDMHYILYYIISISNVFLLQLNTVRMDMLTFYTCIFINFAQEFLNFLKRENINHPPIKP